jgi:hypothetical protein
MRSQTERQDHPILEISPIGKSARGSQQLREKFEEMQSKFEENASEIEVPRDLKEQVRAVLDEHGDLRWDDAIQIVLDGTQLDRVRAEKQKAKKKSGDFADADEDRPESESEDAD